MVFGSKAANLGNADPSVSALGLMESPPEQDLTCTHNSPLLPSFPPNGVCLSRHPSLLLGFSSGPIFGGQRKQGPPPFSRGHVWPVGRCCLGPRTGFNGSHLAPGRNVPRGSPPPFPSAHRGWGGGK